MIYFLQSSVFLPLCYLETESKRETDVEQIESESGQNVEQARLKEKLHRQLCQLSVLSTIY